MDMASEWGVDGEWMGSGWGVDGEWMGSGWGVDGDLPPMETLSILALLHRFLLI